MFDPEEREENCRK
ncbi:hypothetical protein RDABS01_004624 [Bienertia sinuspersici]